jgi:ribosomal protein S18 acetylase RimI-like enzyme
MSQGAENEFLQRLEYDPADYAPSGWEVATVTPFRVMLSPDLGHSEATPVEPIDDFSRVADAIERLLGLAAAKGCTFELQFNEPLWPGLSGSLKRTDLVLSKREMLMICTPETFRPSAEARIQARFLDSSDPQADFRAFQSINGGPSLAIGGSCRAVLARLHGQHVGTGYSWCNAGRSQITRIHTKPAARRQGVASTVMTLLLEDTYDRCGDLVWLTASGPPAQALYEKIGFRSIGYRRFYKAREPDRGLKHPLWNRW